MDQLVKYRHLLDKENLLIYNPLFKEYLLNKNILVIGYGELDKFSRSVIKGQTVEFLSYTEETKKYAIDEFIDIEDEIENLYNQISALLIKGIDINHIYVLNNSEDYLPYFKRYNTYFNFKIEEKDNESIIGEKLTQEFLKMIESKSREEIYDFLVEKDNEVANKLIALINKYVSFDLKEVSRLIIDDLQSITINKHFNNIVKIANMYDSFTNDDYVFLIGFNDTVPKTKKDNQYLTNNLRRILNIDSIEELNALTKANLRVHLSNIKNLFISSCLSSPFETHNHQIIFNDSEVNYQNKEGSLKYSTNLNKEKYAKKLDDLRKYNVVDNNLGKMFNSYDNNDYLSFNNRFSGLDDKKINELIKQINSQKNNQKDLVLSYSSMNNFFECNFKYYLDSVLKIKEPFGNYYTRLGSVCHGVLEDLYKVEEFNFEESWINNVNKVEEKEGKKIAEDAAEEFFVNKIKDELSKDVEIVKLQKSNSLLDKQKCENNYTIDVCDKTKFTGFIDKLMYKEYPDYYLVSVVDYKTSKDIEIDKDIMKYGLSLQLPSYLYLIRHAKEFNKEVKFAGFYIQHLINSENKYVDKETSLDDVKKDSMKLDGISSCDYERMRAGDLSLQPGSGSENIKSLRANKDGGLKKSSRLYSDEEFEDLIIIVDENIKKASEDILNGDFSINPKIIDDENRSCRFCPYKQICFKKEGDYVYLSTKEIKEQ